MLEVEPVRAEAAAKAIENPLAMGFQRAQGWDMMGPETRAAPGPTGQPFFATTHWSVVLTASKEGTPESAAALENLCGTYWYPLYAYVRRRGYSPEHAQDLVQEFFGRLLQRKWLPRADPHRGRFRSFLLVSMNHFLANEWDRAQAAKRGGGVRFQLLEGANGEQRFADESQLARSPEEVYEQRWAMTLLQTVLARLRAEAGAAGHAEQFEKLEIFLTGEKRTATYAEMATRLGTTEGALKMAAQRLRRRYAELLREEIAHTVERADEVEDEIRHLLGVLAG